MVKYYFVDIVTKYKVIVMTNFVHKPTLMFYRRLIKTMMKTFVGDSVMFHRCRIDARKKIMESSHLRDPV